MLANRLSTPTFERPERRQFGEIVAFRTPATGRIIAFHSDNLEVAAISPAAWQAMGANSVEAVATADLREWSESQSTDVKADPASTAPRLNAITINVTQVCNLACTYCAAGGDGTFGQPVKRIAVEKTIPQLRFLMDRAAKQVLGSQPAAFQITFLGGEPLLYPQGIQALAEVAEELAASRNLRLRFVVVTNGTLFTAENITLLERLKASVTVSLDGPAEINDQRRPGKSGQGVTQQVLDGIRRLMAVRGSLTRVGISGIFGRGHMNLMAAWNLYRSLGVDGYEFGYDHDEISPEDSRQFADELSRVARAAFIAGGEIELRKIKTFDQHFNNLDHQQRVESFCGAGKTFLMVDAKNQTTICPWMVGRPQDIVGSGESLDDAKLQPFQGSLIEKNNCQSCWARNLCGGGCMYIHENRTGKKHQVDDNFCERMQILLATAFDLYLEARQPAELETTRFQSAASVLEGGVFDGSRESNG